MKALSPILLSTVALASALVAPASVAAAQASGLVACRLEGVAHDALCGRVRRALDSGQPQGQVIEVHFAVLPALARNPKPDPVFFFAGGPGQSAIEMAGSIGRLLARFGNRRDVVLVDQRGTGRSAPLRCAESPPTQPLALAADPQWQTARLTECRRQLQAMPHGDLRHYSTWLAVQDVEAVRLALGAGPVNVVAASYGTRVGLEYMRQFPAAVRRAVLDGVAPADMALPTSAASDNQAVLDALLASCEADDACRARHPALRRNWQRLLADLPREVSVSHPVTGRRETFVASRELVLALIRAPLYSPALAAAVPHALSEAAEDRFEALFGLASAFAPGRRGRIAEGMHFSVVCSEDLAGRRPGQQLPPDPSGDFGDNFAVQYARVCADWPRAEVPAAFYTLPPARSATLLMSGGSDPATPPHHAQRVAAALGPRARHVVVAQAGHGVMALPCMRDVVFRFIEASSDEAALKVDADCAAKLPQARAFWPPAAGTAP
jgi:pimeloyl-ACP methyl ester carboxylesterase